jgi:hypothetical protein
MHLEAMECQLLWKFQQHPLPPPEGMDRSFSKKNPPGFEKESSLGAAAAVERLTAITN